MNKEVAQELKKKTGITLELQTVSNEDSTEALTSDSLQEIYPISSFIT